MELERLKEEYINNLLINHNNVDDNTQKNLYTKEDFEQLLDFAYRVLESNKDASIDELRDLLFEASGLEESVVNFIRNRKLAPSMSISYGTKNYNETLSIGKLDNGKTVGSNTIYDIASVSKIFTSISILKLASEGVINLNDKLGKYIPEFENLKDVTILDLLTFKVPLVSDRIGAKDDYDSAFTKLKSIRINEDFPANRNPYTDMGAMVLRYVVEKASGMKMFDYVNETIIKKANMNNTGIIVPESKLDTTASTNNVYSFYNDGNMSLKDDIKTGVVNDEKARVLGQNVNDFAGHAGIFTTSKDMVNLSNALLNHEIINSDLLENMSKNETGKEFEPGKYVQYLGKLCYSKNPVQSNSEVYHPLSGKAIGSGGYTGTQYTLDPLNNVFFFMGANRTHNRAVLLGKDARINLENENKIYYDEKGAEIIRVDDNNQIINAVKFAWDRDEAVVHIALKLALAYGLLEYVYKDELEYSYDSASRSII